MVQENASTALKQTVIEPKAAWIWSDLREIIEFRELLFVLSRRDIIVRYRQAILGGLWAILQPAMMMVIFTVVFGRLAKIPSAGLPFPVFVFAGLLLWTLFQTVVSNSSISLVSSSHLVTKVYFPRLIIPIAAAGSAIVDFAFAAAFFAALALWYDVDPRIALLVLPMLALIIIVTALGIGIFLSALIVSYRDFRFVVPFMLQVGMFMTPVVYPAALVPDEWRQFYLLNPVAGVIETFRSILAGASVELWPIVAAMGVSALLVLVGIAYFEKVERRFADVI